MDGNVGTSPGEVYLVSFFVPASLLLLQLISSISHFNKLFTCLEVVLPNLVLLLSLTLFSGHLLYLLILHIVILIVAFYLAFNEYTLREITLKLNDLRGRPIKDLSKAFVGDYRGHLLLATSICILAVDFPIFPSRFAKTETFGWSVMDAGVGSFVVLHGLCSSHAKHIHQNSFKRCFKSSFPLLVLGFLRLALTTAVGYHKVVSEYGIHWNFFFTLALTKVICYSTLSKLDVSAGLLATGVLAAHQLLLWKISDFVLSPERRGNILEANKEGICSLPGFISLYFSGVQLGRMIWRKREKMWEHCTLLVKMCSVGFCCWILMYALHEWCQPVSRRMANLSYCVWTISLTSLQISIHLCYRIIITFVRSLLKIRTCDNLLWNVLNHSGLFYFLLANLLTGLVNLTFNTADSSDIKSLCILILYLTALFASSFTLYKFNVKL